MAVNVLTVAMPRDERHLTKRTIEHTSRDAAEVSSFRVMTPCILAIVTNFVTEHDTFIYDHL